MKLIPFIGALCAITLSLLLSPFDGYGQRQPELSPDSLLSLDDLLAEVRTTNPTLKASRLESEALALRSRQVSVLPNPTVRFAYQPYSLLTARGLQRSQWSVEQAFPKQGELGLKERVADLSATIKHFEAETYEADLLLHVKHWYYELYRIQQQESRILAFKVRLRNFEEAAATRYEVGAGLQQAILKAQLERNGLSRRHFELSVQRRTAAEALARLLDRPTSRDFLATIEVEALPQTQLDVAALLELALSERPEYDALDAAASRADAEIALAQKQFRPDFGLSLTYFDVARTDELPTATGRNAVGIGAVVRVPLQRDRLRAQVEEARVRRSQVNARLEALETSFATQIADLVHQLQEEARQLALFEEGLIPQSETALQSTLNSYASGSTDYLDLLDSERTLFSLGTSYEDTFARYLQTVAALERALGVDSLTDLIMR